MNIAKLRELYKSYGFEELKISNTDILVFTLKNGHFHNADIIKVNNATNVDDTFKQLSELHYACTVRDYVSLDDAEQALFEGFFSAQETKKRLGKEYNKHVESIEYTLGVTGSYNYIEVSYTVNGEASSRRLLDEIIHALNSERATLVLIEAAAGFGKTCTAFELVNELLKSDSTKVPLFSELSRNRKAKIFRYVFLDEIDRSFPTLRSSLVQAKIKEGRVPVILDGFDELIHQSNAAEDDGYDAAEPMLDTIGELLNENSKVVLTTRRTAIFDGDSFHQWVMNHDDDFDVIRIRLAEPTVEDWLNPEKLRVLNNLSFPIEKLNNPVLLAYLRGVPDADFERELKFGEDIVEKYFTSLLERERERQDLKLTVSEQLLIMRSIAQDMISYDYTSESRDYLEDLISSNHAALLESTRAQYTSSARPTIDELITKLTTHALLDRLGNKNDIGFINEFILGSFVADVVIADSDIEWLGEQRFIEPAVMATIPRSDDRRDRLWNLLKFALLFQASHDKVLYSHYLKGDLHLDLEGDTLSGRVFKNINFGKYARVEDVLFLDCTFQNSNFHKNSLNNVTFVNCHFYQCEVIGDHTEDNENIKLINNDSDNEGFLDRLGDTGGDSPEKRTLPTDSLHDAKFFVLSKFWPKGSINAHKHRPKSVLYTNVKFSYGQLHEAIDQLKSEGILTVPDKASFLELNFEKIGEVKSLLGKDDLHG